MPRETLCAFRDLEKCESMATRVDVFSPLHIIVVIRVWARLKQLGD